MYEIVTKVLWYVFTHADSSRKTLSGVCLHNKTKMAETKITKLDTGIVHHESLPTTEYYVTGSQSAQKLCVCVSVCTITQKQMFQKCSKFHFTL